MWSQHWIMWSTALDHVIHSIRSCDHSNRSCDHSIRSGDHSIGSCDHSIGSCDHSIGSLDHVIHVQYWMCTYDWSVYSTTAIKFMEKNRMGDQTLCSAFSPGKRPEEVASQVESALIPHSSRWQVFCDWRYGSYHPCVHVYTWSPNSPGGTHRTHGELADCDRGHYFQSVQE